MTNTYERGSDMLLKIDVSAGGRSIYRTVGGLQSKGISFKTGTLDVTDQGSLNKWRKLASRGALKSCSLSGSGPFVENDVGFKSVRDAYIYNTVLNCQIIVPGFAIVAGPFVVSQLAQDGKHSGEITYSLSLESADDITVTNLLSTPPVISSGPYNAYSGAESAFGFRRLFSSYSGACVNVVRSIDGAARDIGFVDDQFDIPAFRDFVGSGFGFAAKWYDQSGHGRDAVPPSSPQRPLVVLNAISGTPALQFVAANSSQLNAPGASTGTGDHTMLLVGRTVTRNGYSSLMAYGDASAIGVTNSQIWWQGGQYFTTYGTQTGVVADTLPHVFTKTASGGSGARLSNLWIDAGHTGQNANPDYGSNLTSVVTFGSQVSTGGSFADCQISEALAFPNVTVSRLGLETVANSYFATYDATIINSSSLTTWHVFALAGQSNATGYGHSIDKTIDIRDPNILQWGGGGIYKSTLVNAFEPLSHPDFSTSTGIANNAGLVGFGLAFARAYRATQASNVGVILVPVATGGTGFSTNSWNSGTPGNAAYELAIAQVNACIAAVSGATLKGVLWHQGEAELGISSASAYQTALDALIDGFRARMTGGGSTLPFVVGGMVPEWAADHPPNAPAIALVHAATPSRKTYTGYWAGPSGYADGANYVHYSAAGQRLNAASVLIAYQAALANH